MEIFNVRLFNCLIVYFIIGQSCNNFVLTFITFDYKWFVACLCLILYWLSSYLTTVWLCKAKLLYLGIFQCQSILNFWSIWHLQLRRKKVRWNFHSAALKLALWDLWMLIYKSVIYLGVIFYKINCDVWFLVLMEA